MNDVDRTPQFVLTINGIIDTNDYPSYTCTGCIGNSSCPYAFDGYNTNGDCLNMK